MVRLDIAVAISLVSMQAGVDASDDWRTKRTPLMGWNAWNTFSINGKPLRGGAPLYKEMADAIVESGMRDAGYNLISTVCTDWLGREPVTNVLQQNLTLWPGGMRAYADYIHSKGLLLSVYTNAASRNCCGETGSLGYEDLDVQTFAEWGADAMAVDYCGGDSNHVQEEYQKYVDAIAKSSNPNMRLMVFNLGKGKAYTWAPLMQPTGVAPFYRVTRDIGNTWYNLGATEGIMNTVDEAQAIPDLNVLTGNETGSYPMYGQLAVGVPKDHPTKGDPGLTLFEAQAHFSMWCMFPSALLATNDVRKRDPDIEAILLNPETIAVNQDPLGKAAWRIDAGRTSNTMQWARNLTNGDVAALVINRDDTQTSQVTLYFADVLNGVGGAKYRVRDLQTRTDLGDHCGQIDFTLEPHQTAFVRLTFLEACTAPPTPAPVPSPPPVPSPSGPCPTPKDTPAAFKFHEQRGWYGNTSSMKLIGKKSTVSVPDCAASCLKDDNCAAFHVYLDVGITHSCVLGDCYVHSQPLGAFVPGNDHAFSYDRQEAALLL